MKRDLIWFTGIWVVFVAIGEWLVFYVTFLPGQYADQARIVDDAYLLLATLAVPVFAFVAAVVVFAVVRFKVKGDELEDGPPIRSNRKVVATWLTVTSALTLAILINPGFVGLAEVRADHSADMVVEVQALRWAWIITYPNGATASNELVVPVDTRIRFDVTAVDVLHSFWIPAFRTKIDAVPGRTTVVYVTPTETGTRADDPGLRIQCAEFCGLNHSGMAIPVSVVTEEEFQEYITGLQQSAAIDRRSG